MTNNDLKTILTFCERDACGDPVGGITRSAQYSKRQMVFSGFLYWTYAKYRCPKCQFNRLFRLSFFQTHYVERTSAETRREVRTAVVAIAVFVLSLWVADIVRTRARSAALEEEWSRSRITSAITTEFIETKAEFAEVFQESQVRVLIAAKLRSGAKAEPAAFAPPSGYFLDQDGTRYDAAVMPADKTDKALDRSSPLFIVPGQVYRYYMVAPTHSNPYSDAPPSQTITKLVVFLGGIGRQEVPLRKSGARHRAADEPDDDPNHFK